MQLMLSTTNSGLKKCQSTVNYNHVSNRRKQPIAMMDFIMVLVVNLMSKLAGIVYQKNKSQIRFTGDMSGIF